MEIIIEKHGSDYHPVRIRVTSVAGVQSFVLNVALTERGRARIEREFHLLKELSLGDEWIFVPKVCFIAQSEPLTSLAGKRMIMFLGEWLEGYHEFHYSMDSDSGTYRLMLWDREAGDRFLSGEEEFAIFAQAAMILTFYYDTRLFKEIFPWHHAAGDFVARINAHGDPQHAPGSIRKDRDSHETVAVPSIPSSSGIFVPHIQVKLITVRQYEARVALTTDSQQNARYALFLFLINLSIRMRLDRVDGVGETVWAGDRVLDATMQGFANALKTKAHLGHCTEEFVKEFFHFSAGTSLEDLTGLFQAVVESYDRDAPDVRVIREHLVDHVYSVYRRLQLLRGAADYPARTR